MPSIYSLKPRFQALLRPLCGALARRGVTPNQVTTAAVVLSAATGGCIFWAPTSSWPLIALPMALLVRLALNAIDGMLAREFEQTSRLGVVFNEMGDVASDALLYLPLALHPAIPSWGVVGVVVLAIMIEMVGVVAIQIGAQRRYDGPFGKGDRAVALGILGLLLGLGVPGGIWIAVYMGLAILLSVITLVNRALKAISQGEDTE